MYGDDRVPILDVLSGLVQPVISGKVDMAMVEYSDRVGPLLVHVCITHAYVV